MNRIAAAFAAGLLFGLGLVVSQMINPAKVLAFLDVAGDWDPSVALVLAGAIPVAALGFRLAAGRHAPVLGDRFAGPTQTQIDRPLLFGAGLFGIGWGLVGYCPAPALASLALGHFETGVFILAMLAGMGLHRVRQDLATRRPEPEITDHP